MIRFPTQEAEALRQSEARQSITFAAAFGVFTLVLTVAAAFFGWLLALPFAGYLSALVFIGGGMYVFVILRAGWKRGSGVVTRVVDVAENWFDAEIKLKMSALILPPAPELPLPPENRMIAVSASGRAGQIPLDLVDGWLDPRDADWFAEFLANGNKWTESFLEKMPLPYSGALFGKDRDNSPYRKLMTKCIRFEIIGNRGGPGNYTGDLLLKDPKEIARRLKTPTPA